MQYLGGKSRIAKDLARYMESIREGRPYLEPFMGAASVLVEMSGERVGADILPDLILMWEAVKEGWMPPEVVTEEEYKALRTAPPSPLRGYVGIQGSFSGKWFGGYARHALGGVGKRAAENTIKQGHRSLIYARPRLEGVRLYNCDYTAWSGFKGFLIYCDPPYEGTTPYKDTPRMDHAHFWQWVREMSGGNTVLVSSYEAPKDFVPVWEKATHTEIRGAGGRIPRTEKLFQWAMCLKEED